MKTLFLAFTYCANVFASFDHTHQLWTEILSEYTQVHEKQTLVSYRGLKQNGKKLAEYLNQLEIVKSQEFVKFQTKQKLAFWINAYNAYTVKIILDYYPVKSIKEIKSGFFSSGPWVKEFIPLLGRNMSLDDIEHEVIRKQFKEPRIHFAVNCASMGCPSLLPAAFVADKLDEQLDRAALNFLSNSSKNKVTGNTLYVSKIFKWYGDDFQERYGHFKNYIVQTLKLPAKSYEIEFKAYDWSLNEFSK